MTRLKARHLPHTVNAVSLTGEGAEGETWSTPETGIPAYVEHKSKLVVDRRSTSPTVNQEVTARTFIVLLTANEMLPRTKVTVWPGTARAREVEVIDSSFFSYDARTPNHCEIFAT